MAGARRAEGRRGRSATSASRTSTVAQLRRAQQIAPVATLQPPYSLVERDGRGRDPAVLPRARHRRDRLLADGVGPADRRDDARADRGLPDNDWRRRDERFQEPRSRGTWRLVERLATSRTRHGTTPGAVAIAWTLRNPRSTAPSSASAGLTRSTRSWSPRSSS